MSKRAAERQITQDTLDMEDEEEEMVKLTRLHNWAMIFN